MVNNKGTAKIKTVIIKSSILIKIYVKHKLKVVWIMYFRVVIKSLVYKQ